MRRSVSLSGTNRRKDGAIIGNGRASTCAEVPAWQVLRYRDHPKRRNDVSRRRSNDQTIDRGRTITGDRTWKATSGRVSRKGIRVRGNGPKEPSGKGAANKDIRGTTNGVHAITHTRGTRKAS